MPRDLRILLLAALCVCGDAASAGEIVRADRLVLENEVMRLVFDREDGRIRAVDNLARGLSLLPEVENPSHHPRLTLFGKQPPKIEHFAFEVLERSDEHQALRLTWSFNEDITLEVRAELSAGSEMAFLWPRVLNEGRERINSLYYPSFSSLSTLGESAEDDVLVHAFVRGMKIFDPKKSLDIPHNPIKETNYPQAYNGMTHQLIDYYSEGLGGFFFATFDPHSTEKSVEMPLEGGELGMAWRYRSWDQRPGVGMELGFPFVFGVNTTGDWYRAADHYREWALSTEWCKSAGPNAQKPAGERADWLFEDVGLATFGLAMSVDQSPWYQAYHDILDAPVFHVTGLDWLEAQGRGGDPLDMQTGFHRSNLETIERSGDYSAVFLADLKTTFLPLEMAHEVGRLTVSVVPRATPEACPANGLWRYIHARRAVRALVVSGADSFYHDASAPNRGLLCESREHGHPPGRGRWMNDNYRDLYAGSHAALSEACARYTPVGVELMHEGLIDRFDYYQVRNGAGFMGGLEGGFYRGLQLRGKAETVPVFSYIYHDYAPVALDGCGKVSERIGDIFYWMAARVALWGGIFEVNNEFSPSERFPGMSDVGILHYREHDIFEWIDSEHPANSPYDEHKGEFVREIAAARTSFATDFLAYGQMLPPLEVECEEVELGFVYYNNIDWGGRPNSLEFADASGTYASPSVLTSAWKFEDRLGCLFVNLTPNEVRVDVRFELSKYGRYGLSFGESVVGERVTRAGRRPFRIAASRARELVLPSRRVVLFEFKGR